MNEKVIKEIEYSTFADNGYPCFQKCVDLSKYFTPLIGLYPVIVFSFFSFNYKIMFKYKIYFRGTYFRNACYNRQYSYCNYKNCYFYNNGNLFYIFYC